MAGKSYWIWHYGDYEIYHIMKMSFRREEGGYVKPPFWKISGPYMNVKFTKTFQCEKDGYLIAHTTGEGGVDVDGKRHRMNTRIELSAGEHTIDLLVQKDHGLPACYVESDVCPSDASWLCNHFAGDMTAVGTLPYFDSVDKSPEVFPFEYEKKEPVSVEKKEGGMLFDFGTELFGYVNISGANPEETFGVFYGESDVEACDTELAAIHEYVSGQSEYRLRQRAFRYIFVTTMSESICVTADYEYLPLKQKGFFSCNNQVFNDIFSVAAYTFHLNCREGFLDGIKRDRWIWAGDSFQSARVNSYLWADKEIVQRTAIGHIGKSPVEQHINTILDYSFLWIIGLYEYYMSYGDLEFLGRIYPMAQELIAYCESKQNADGFIVGGKGSWTFIDWAVYEKVGAVCAEQVLFTAAYYAMAAIADALHIENTGYFEKGEAFKERLNKFYWNEEKGAYIDSYRSGNNHVTRHANIFAIMFDIATPRQQEIILERVLKNDEIAQITTPYFRGYELDALAKLGQFEEIEKSLESYWGGMIKLGAKTFWESYIPEQQGIEHYAFDAIGGKATGYGKSLCHAWGAGPIYLFGKYYLGVTPTSAGFETFRVEPRLGGLKEISGIAPANDGQVEVKIDKQKLVVKANKAGGILVWQGKEYALVPNEEMVIIF